MPFVVFLGGFTSRCQNLSSGAIRPGGLLFNVLLLFANLLKSGPITFLAPPAEMQRSFSDVEFSVGCPSVCRQLFT